MFLMHIQPLLVACLSKHERHLSCLARGTGPLQFSIAIAQYMYSAASGILLGISISGSGVSNRASSLKRSSFPV